MEGRQQALMFLESGEQERTLRGQEFASKGWIAVVLSTGSAAAEVLRRVKRPIARVMEESSFMVACYKKGYRLLYCCFVSRRGKAEEGINERLPRTILWDGERGRMRVNQEIVFMQIRRIFFPSFGVRL